MDIFTTPCASALPGPIALSAGQTLWLRLRRGDALMAADAGTVLSEAPQWLAERWMANTVHLDVEARHIIERSGWIRLHASRPARLRLLARPPRGAWLMRLVASAPRPALQPARASER